LAIASLILGILACVSFCLPPLAGLLGLLAIVFGLIGMNKPVGGGMAKTGLVLGIVGIGLTIGFYVVVKVILKKGGDVLQQKAQELQQKAEEMQKQADEMQKKAEERARQNSTSQPGMILFHPAGWTVVLD
jgi:hypothetical protein